MTIYTMILVGQIVFVAEMAISGEITPRRGIGHLHVQDDDGIFQLRRAVSHATTTNIANSKGHIRYNPQFRFI
jgi:hypothetical protein